MELQKLGQGKLYL